MEPTSSEAISARAETRRACASCGAPSGSREMCTHCLLERLEQALDRLLADESHGFSAEVAAQVEELRTRVEGVGARPLGEELAEADPAAPEEIEVSRLAPLETPDALAGGAEAPPPSRAPRRARRSRYRRRRGLLALGLLALAGAGATIVLVGGDGESPAPADDEPAVASAPPAAAPAAGEEPPAAPATAETPADALLGTWSGSVEVTYSDGTEDRLEQTIELDTFAEGAPAGTARSTQNDVTCRGELTYRGPAGAGYRFSYREQNTAECIASSAITLTPRDDGTVALREVTEGSVNRGTLRAAG